MAAPTLTPPNTLDTAGMALWRSIVNDVAAGWELDSRDLTLLTAACQSADTIAKLDAIVAAEGVTVRGSKGQSRVHPAVAETRTAACLDGSACQQD